MTATTANALRPSISGLYLLLVLGEELGGA